MAYLSPSTSTTSITVTVTVRLGRKLSFRVWEQQGSPSCPAGAGQSQARRGRAGSGEEIISPLISPCLCAVTELLHYLQARRRRRRNDPGCIIVMNNNNDNMETRDTILLLLGHAPAHQKGKCKVTGTFRSNTA